MSAALLREVKTYRKKDVRKSEEELSLLTLDVNNNIAFCINLFVDCYY